MNTTLKTKLGRPAGSPPVEWQTRSGLTPYPEAVSTMEERVASIRDGKARELIWLVDTPTPLHLGHKCAR